MSGRAVCLSVCLCVASWGGGWVGGCREEEEVRSAAVSSLVQVLLCPHYRTLAGLRALLLKDWPRTQTTTTPPPRKKKKQSAASHPAVFQLWLDALHQVRREGGSSRRDPLGRQGRQGRLAC